MTNSDNPVNSTEKDMNSKNAEPFVQAELSAENADRISQLEEELSGERDKFLRIFAEFENFKKRSARERIELLKYSNADVIGSLLPVLDDFERASKAGQLSEGLNLIYQKLSSILASKGLKNMEVIGKDFDPDLHDAISQQETSDPAMKNKITEEVERGYYLEDRVIRHAKVVVAV